MARPGTRSSKAATTGPSPSCGRGASSGREAGWQPIRLAVGPSRDRPRAGVQLLLRRLPLGGWSLAYAPRGPIGPMDDPGVRDALLDGLRELAADRRIGRMRADPETAADEPYGSSLLGPTVAPGAQGPAARPPASSTSPRPRRSCGVRWRASIGSTSPRPGGKESPSSSSTRRPTRRPPAVRWPTSIGSTGSPASAPASRFGSRPTTSGCGRRSAPRTGRACSSRSATGSGWPPCST